MVRTAALLALCLAAPPVLAKAPEMRPEPSEHPDWQVAAAQVVAELRKDLIDPESLRVEWTSGFRWATDKAPFFPRRYGWVACGTFNARNRMGGYAGSRGFYAFIDDSKGLSMSYFAPDDLCGRNVSVPAQPELLTATERPTAAPSVADEIAKLASLRKEGVLTDAEFEAQKAKLLAP